MSTEIKPERKTSTDSIFVINPNIPVEQLCEDLGVEIEIDLGRITPWSRGVSTPSEPYNANLNIHPSKSWEKTTGDFKSGERGATVVEGLALVKFSPEILDSMDMLFPGSALGMYEIVKIYKDKESGKIKLGAQFVGFKPSRDQAIVSCKR